MRGGYFRSAGVLLFVKFTVWSDKRIVSDGTHACSNRSQQVRRSPRDQPDDLRRHELSSFLPLPRRCAAHREESDTLRQI